MKNKISFYIITLVFFSYSNTYAAPNTLDVLVLFDSSTTSYSYSERNSKANFFVNSLNDTIQNSNLDGDIKFRLDKHREASVMLNKNSFNDLINTYEQSFVPVFSNTVPTNRAIYTYQKLYRSDIVIVVANPSQETHCGVAMGVPSEVYKDPGMSDAQLLSVAHLSVVFLRGTTGCSDNERVVSHEVGHTFGLSHGEEVREHTNRTSDYPNSLLRDYAGGHANYSFLNSRKFHTIMGTDNTNVSDNIWHNFYSDPNKNDCSDRNVPCGTSNANAITMIKIFKTSFSQRSNWWN